MNEQYLSKNLYTVFHHYFNRVLVNFFASLFFFIIEHIGQNPIKPEQTRINPVAIVIHILR